MRIIGSGAAEAIPNPLCSCGICESARKARGRDIRSRTCFRVDDATQIDFGPDQFYQATVLGNDLRTVRQVLVTHSHEDHLAFTEFNLKQMASVTNPDPIDVYLSRPAHAWLLNAAAPFDCAVTDETYVRLHPVDYGVAFQAGNLTVLPLKGNHFAHGTGENSINYHITFADGSTLYYAVDTGYFLEDTLERLRMLRVDTLVVEGTFGDAPGYETPHTDGHMGAQGVLAVTRRLYEQGTLHDASRVYVTHVNHKHSLTYPRMVDWFAARPAPVPITVGYDGMEIPGK